MDARSKLGDEFVMPMAPLIGFAIVIIALLVHRWLTRRLDALLKAATISLRTYAQVSDRLRVVETQMERVLLGLVDPPRGISPQTREEIARRVVAEAAVFAQRRKIAEADLRHAQAAAAPEAIRVEADRQLNRGPIAALRDAAEQANDETPLGLLEHELRRIVAELEREHRAVNAPAKAEAAGSNDAPR